MTDTTSSKGWEAEGKSPAEIESDIERTRERMSEEIDAIGEKFSPGHIKQRAREAVTDAKEAVVEKVQEASGEVGRKAKQMGSGLVDLVRENPLPAAAAGISLYWLFSRRKGSDGYSRSYGRTRGSIGRYDYGARSISGRGSYESGSEEESGSGKLGSAKEKVQEWTSEAGDKMQEWKSEASDKAHELGRQARRATSKLEDFFEQSPLITAAGVVVLGAVIGASIPSTEKENELMGGVRDDLVDRVEEVAGQARETLKEKMSEPGGQGQRSTQPGTPAYTAPTQQAGGMGSQPVRTE